MELGGLGFGDGVCGGSGRYGIIGVDGIAGDPSSRYDVRSCGSSEASACTDIGIGAVDGGCDIFVAVDDV